MEVSKIIDFSGQVVEINPDLSENVGLPVEQAEDLTTVSFPSGTTALSVFLDNGDTMVVASLPDREKFVHFHHLPPAKDIFYDNPNRAVEIYDSSYAYETFVRLRDEEDLDDLSNVIFPRVLDNWKKAGIEFRNISKPWINYLDGDDDIGGYFLPDESYGFKTEYADYQHITFKSDSGVWIASTNLFVHNSWSVQSLDPFMVAFEMLSK